MPSASQRRRCGLYEELEARMRAGLKVQARNGGDDVVVSVQGDVDLATAPELEAALARALEGPAARLVVDLRGVEFLDSSGLSLLVRQDRAARGMARRLIVIKGPPQVHHVFEVTGLSEHLTMLDELPD
jgi:anti-sigma B factor antagonist